MIQMGGYCNKSGWSTHPSIHSFVHLFSHFVHYWLVVDLPPWKILVSWDDEIPNIWKNKIHVPVTTNQICLVTDSFIHCFIGSMTHWLSPRLCDDRVKQWTRSKDEQWNGNTYSDPSSFTLEQIHRMNMVQYRICIGWVMKFRQHKTCQHPEIWDQPRGTGSLGTSHALTHAWLGITVHVASISIHLLPRIHDEQSIIN